MKTIIAIMLICIMHISVSAEQASISKNTFFAKSKSLASEMGRTFQLAQNCGQGMENISASTAIIFFQNYFDGHEVSIIMKQYIFYVEQEKGKLCNREKVEFHVLMNKIAIYIRMAAPFTKRINGKINGVTSDYV